MELSVIILTYNSSKYIENLLEGIVKKYIEEINKGYIEIIVADNSSEDETIKKASKFKEHIKIIQNSDNFGYAKGNNLAAKKAKGKSFLFMNPDTEVSEGSFLSITKKFDDGKVGVVGGEILNFRGLKELSCGKFYGAFNVFLLSIGLEEVMGVRFSPEKSKEVDFVSGAFLAVRADIFKRIGGFDENYFMYVEDSDLCFRVKKLGYKILFSKDASIRHVGQGSSNRAFAVLNIYKGLLYFNKKRIGIGSYLFVLAVFKIKALILVLVGKIMNNKYLSSTYSEVLHL